MAENARRKMEKTEKRKKKGGSSSNEPSKKKRKGDAGEKLKTALVKDAQVRAGSKPIFVQPENLSDGCFLMDYQLEGVRWLASLFENGVSGILADEVRKENAKMQKINGTLYTARMPLVFSPLAFTVSSRLDGFGKNDSSHCFSSSFTHNGRNGTISCGGTPCDAPQLGP